MEADNYYAMQGIWYCFKPSMEGQLVLKTMAKLAAAAMTGVALSLAVSAQQVKPDKAVDVLEMKSVPDGHYLLNLETGAAERLVNIEVKNASGKCVNSSDPQLKGLEGKFEFIGNGVFTVVFRNKHYTMTQWWLFRPDGSATVKEVPDRGETQRAIPVSDESLSRPKESR